MQYNINFLKAIAIIAVVVLHASATVLINIDITLHLPSWTVANVFDSITRWCVPLFVIISGYLLLDPVKLDEDCKTFYKKRLNKIVIPLIFWSLFFLILSLVRLHIKNSELDIYKDVFDPILYGKPFYHMWFLFMILGLYLITPFLRIMILKITRDKLFVFMIVSYIISMIFFNCMRYYNINIYFIFEWINYLPYFLTGYFLREASKRYLKLTLIVFILAIVFTILITQYLSINYEISKQYGMYFYGYLTPNIVLMSVSLTYVLFYYIQNNKIKFYRWVEYLGRESLGIYLIHPLFILGFNLTFGIPSSVVTTFLFIVLVSISSILLSIIVLNILRKISILQNII